MQRMDELCNVGRENKPGGNVGEMSGIEHGHTRNIKHGRVVFK